jgi:hypothetical protein
MMLSKFRNLFAENVVLAEEFRVTWEFPNGYGANLIHTHTGVEVVVSHGVRVCYDSPVATGEILVSTLDEVEVILEKIQLIEEDK